VKIISGGQTGVDRAALDAAIDLGVDYGGAIPHGRKAEDGPIDEKYTRLKELESDAYKERTRENVLDGDATLILAAGSPMGGTAVTIKYAAIHHKPCLVVDLETKDNDALAAEIIDWLKSTRPAVLNVAGPRESQAPGIYRRVYPILYRVLQIKEGIMQIEERTAGNILIVKPLEKRIDASLAPEFKGLMIDRIGAGNTKILLDLSDVEFIDSSGLGAIVSSLKALGGKGDFAICCLKETVSSLFRLTRMDRIFQIFASEEEALKTL
jgi:anti-anti-sigma factor